MPAPTAQSRSPSPAPPAPLADSPGPRATALQTAFAKALESTLKKCSYENFAACFPTPAAHRPETMDAFWRDFTGRLDAVCKAQFDALLADRAVIPSLNSLDHLIADAKKRKERAEAAAPDGKVDVPVPPHTLPPTSLHLAHLAPFLAAQSTHLQTELSAVQQSNATLVDEITAQRAEMEALISGLETVVADLEASAQMLQGEGAGLAGEVQEIEMELRGLKGRA